MSFERRTAPVGARPGTLALDPDAADSRVRTVFFSERELVETEGLELEAVRGARRSGGNVWIDVQGLGDESLLRTLADEFSIHPLALEDLVHFPVRPKAEGYGENVLLISRMLRPAGHDDATRFEVETEQIGFVVGPDYVLTFQEAHGDVLDPMRRRLRDPGSNARRTGPGYLAYGLLDTIVDAYYPVVEALGDRLEGLEEQVLEDPRPDVLATLTMLKGTLLRLRRAVVPQREAINTLIREDFPAFDPRVKVYLRDTYDHVVHTGEALETARELVNGLLNTYLTVVSNRMNDVMKTLTIVASLFVPLTFMAGIYGMNFERMPELGWRWGYPALIGAMTAVAVAMLWYFKRKGWIGGTGRR